METLGNMSQKDTSGLRNKYNYFINGAKKYQDNKIALQLADECQEMNEWFRVLAGDDEEKYMSYKPFDLSVFDYLYVA